MVTAEARAARRQEIAGSSDLQALLAHLVARAAPLLERLPPIPTVKALLSADGGICPDDGAALEFDPWSPHQHRCPRCGKTWSGERHDRHWARFQHLWMAERAAHLAALGALADNAAAAARASEILRAYARSYWTYPNRDNVLGPSRLFFSTYLESIWILNFLAAAVLLRASGRLDDATARGVGQVADEAANLIGEFDEGFSNRQTWNDAALAAIAVWFEDAELAARAVRRELCDSDLHDAPSDLLPSPVSRRSLSWWALFSMVPELPSDVPPWVPRSVLLESQGLAVLRAGTRYVSLECGPLGGGHGHPDRLHLTLHADGMHWLPGFG